MRCSGWGSGIRISGFRVLSLWRSASCFIDLIGFEELRIRSLSHTDYGAEDFGLIGFR